MADIEKQKLKLAKMLEAAAKEQAKLLVAEKQEKERHARQAARDKAKERAKLFRSADAHRKIGLGGLVIAAGADGWDEAEIVGALLVIAGQLEREPQKRNQLREHGLKHLEERAAAREAARS
ncbi:MULTISPECIES: conjugal transfer protein TraD [Xanthomonas]|uniref:Conjugal transfer protein TraD n=1 Tax=Xanthomonas arboricola TaxID=56448 RepID=A0AAU9HUQ3_9XANT|nr:MULTISPECIES: conjugal transfer protein TraD [Xanthomonas]MCC3253795.1 conjugal transfer protein TraD [Xanthomonas campestris pv. armoraciae]MCC5048325.1 conjugal transfer protein TraD [Xanthomonas campestris]MCC5055858.1 conjugal transfer protein TraD [Xanthomonas campestris]MCC5059880.1 conjugal transfer protein TraD [Xanthomonas campestris]MCE4552078.1 conjugal transfer protein TraD [Xanthomonas hortorum pv. vitians]